MKKTYKSPAMSVATIETQHVIASSPLVQFDADGTTGTGTLVTTEEATGAAWGRRSSLWDSDED